MKTKIFYFLILLMHSGFSQKNSSVLTLVKQINTDLKLYDKLPYFDETLPLKDYEIKRMNIIDDNGDEKSLSAKDSVNSMYLKNYFQGRIYTNMEKLLSHPEIVNFDLDTLLENISVVKSSDKRLYNLSYDAKNGGTYRMSISFMHYRGIDSIQNNFKYSFSEDGYNSIQTINTSEGTKYLLFTNVRYCSLCFGESATLISYKEGDFKEEFETQAESRYWNSKINYSDSDSTLTVYYSSDDLNSGCSCVPDENREHTCKFTYRFNGLTFTLYKQEIIFEAMKEDE